MEPCIAEIYAVVTLSISKPFIPGFDFQISRSISRHIATGAHRLRNGSAALNKGIKQNRHMDGSAKIGLRLLGGIETWIAE